MGSGMYVAMAGARAQSDALDTTANNVANAGTAGFRAERIAFSEMLSRARAPDMAYAAATRSRPDTTQGAIRTTDNPLDLAIRGDGFFAVQTPAGVRYTRDGAFRLDADGQIVDARGFALLDQSGAPLSVPPETGSIDVGADGTVRADGVEVGVVQIARFSPDQLRREGNNLFVARGAPRAASDDLPEVVSGALEQSNVNVVRGMVGLVKVSRTYEALLRMIESYRDIDARTARDIGGPK
ncbi:MAG: flagellar basal-body rod protein FlgF [Deltaproteobacteria bacterium]|nr:MAG: flagellar basal-body rod protein FlgF [Deltaproteobacteria bacterium]